MGNESDLPVILKLWVKVAKLMKQLSLAEPVSKFVKSFAFAWRKAHESCQPVFQFLAHILLKVESVFLILSIVIEVRVNLLLLVIFLLFIFFVQISTDVCFLKAFEEQLIAVFPASYLHFTFLVNAATLFLDHFAFLLYLQRKVLLVFRLWIGFNSQHIQAFYIRWVEGILVDWQEFLLDVDSFFIFIMP